MIAVFSMNAFSDYYRIQLVPWTLTDGDGVKTVYVKYFSENGGYPGFESPIISDTIILKLGLGGLPEEPVIEEQPAEQPPAQEVSLSNNLPTSIGRPDKQCVLLITRVLRQGYNNDRDQVAKLQTFLREVVGFKDMPTTGYFGPITDKYVRLFQNMYPNDILKPQGLSAPTGIVARFTMNAINYLNCFVIEDRNLLGL
jgi:hypothetical protein